MLHSLFRHAFNEFHPDNFLFQQKHFAETANFKLELHTIYEKKYLESMWVSMHT